MAGRARPSALLGVTFIKSGIRANKKVTRAALHPVPPPLRDDCMESITL